MTTPIVHYYDYDIFNQAEVPAIMLVNPNRERIASIGRIIYDTQLTLRFNAISEFSFKIPQSIDGGQTILPVYEKIQVKRQIHVDGIGYFIINSAVENADGSVPIMEVKAESLEAEFLSKKLNLLKGTGRLYDYENPDNIEPIGEDSSIMGYILSLINNGVIGEEGAWTVRGKPLGGGSYSLDATLMAKYRTFDVSDSTIYSFLMNDVEKAFECIFVFDTINRIIHILTLEQAVTNTNVYISYDNLAKNTELSEMADEIATGLYVYGGDGLDIRSVNPTGLNIIYDFGYYKTTEWMTQGLINAITSWEEKIASKQDEYDSLLEEIIAIYNGIVINGVVEQKGLAQYNTEMAEAQADLAAAEISLKAAIEAGLDTTQANQAVADAQAVVDSIQAYIDDLNTTLGSSEDGTGLLGQAKFINNYLDIANDDNFTNAQRIELSRYMLQNTYQNENIIVTDLFTPGDEQDIKLQLRDQALNVLSRVSRPRYEFSVDAVNFINLKEFSVFTNQIPVVLGAKITVETSKYPVESVLLELKLSFDKPEDFSMTFGNRLRLDNGAYQFTDLLGEPISTGSSVSYNTGNWSNWADNYKNDVTEFITSALDASKNAVVNASNQEIIINQAGMRGRRFNSETNQYGPQEVWLTSNTIAFTDDGWNTAKLALGAITLPDGQNVGYGIVGQYIIGNIIAGNQLNISSANGNFRVDETGATLYNAKFTLRGGSGGGMIIDPNQSNIIQMGVFTGNTIQSPNFTVAFNGDITMKGNLYAGSNYILTNGNVKLGALTITGSTATFQGDIYANKLIGTVDWSQITNAPLPASRVGSGYSAGYLSTGSGNQVQGALYVQDLYAERIWTISGIISFGSIAVNNNISATSLTLTGGIQMNAGSYPGAGANGRIDKATVTYIYVANGIITSWA